MRWRGRRRSTQIEDRRRGRGSARGFPFPMGRGGRIGGRPAGMGCGVLLVLILVAYIFGVDPTMLLQNVPTDTPGAFDSTPASRGGSGEVASDEAGQFISTVLASTEDIWSALFQRQGRRYRLPKLVLFDGAVDSACGFNSAAVGPFYCPADQKVYIDLTFFRQLAHRFGAPGDFAQAYVLAHEIGHHVQKLTGVSDQVSREQRRRSRSEGNELSVRLELQADCYAGVWGYHARELLEAGDVEEGLRAAAAIGDDTIQRRSGGRISPESWTHGSSDMRVRWLRRGLQSGDPDSCDTFGRSRL